MRVQDEGFTMDRQQMIACRYVKDYAPTSKYITTHVISRYHSAKGLAGISKDTRGVATDGYRSTNSVSPQTVKLDITLQYPILWGIFCPLIG
jgi:hypothetical protein